LQTAGSRRCESSYGRTDRRSCPGHNKPWKRALNQDALVRKERTPTISWLCRSINSVKPIREPPFSNDFINLFGSGYAGLGSSRLQREGAKRKTLTYLTGRHVGVGPDGEWRR
jgi:hypothetical protein